MADKKKKTKLKEPIIIIDKDGEYHKVDEITAVPEIVVHKENPRVEAIDIFEQALADTVKGIEQTAGLEPVTSREVDLPMVKKTRRNWKELKTAIDNEHAHRFNDILNNLPDREFARVYLKSLEFFKPKVIRQAGGQGEVVDQTINIQINYGDKK